MKTTIFTVTVFQKIKHNKFVDNDQIVDLGDRHCIGWLSSLDEAKAAIMMNMHNLRADMYDYAIIEEMPDGINKSDVNRILFKWDNTTQSYVEINIPKELECLSNFGIG